MTILGTEITDGFINDLVDGSIILLRMNLHDSTSLSNWITLCKHIAELIYDKSGKSVVIVPVPTGSKVKLLRTEPSDIIAIQVPQLNDAETVTKKAVDVLIRTLKEANIGHPVGIVGVLGTGDILLLGDEQLSEFGLVKIRRVIDAGVTPEQLSAMGLENIEGNNLIDISSKKPEPVAQGKRLYVLHPSQSVSCADLEKFYDVDSDECLTEHELGILKLDPNDFFHLYPRLDGLYYLPVKKGR